MSSILTLQQRKKAFIKLGEYLLSDDEQLLALISTAHHHNAWFTPKETRKAVRALGGLLNETDLKKWLSEVPDVNTEPKKIGLVLAGNIPMVGFHDILTVLASGHIALIKQSSQDKVLLPAVVKKLIELEPAFADQVVFSERLTDFDAVIATGSNNTSRYFEYYFGKVPHIIRKNRSSVAVISGKESDSELYMLGSDIFDYFGLGCRNISKIFVPEGYNFNSLFEAIEPYKSVIDHHKYSNNYDYNKSIFLVNQDLHFDNGFLLLKPDTRLASPLAVVYYEEYKSLDSVEAEMETHADQIQCLVSKIDLQTSVQLVRFGESQKPKIWDYADRVNTLDFLLRL